MQRNLIPGFQLTAKCLRGLGAITPKKRVTDWQPVRRRLLAEEGKRPAAQVLRGATEGEGSDIHLRLGGLGFALPRSFFAIPRHVADFWRASSVGARQSIRSWLAFFDSNVFTFAMHLIQLPTVGKCGGCTSFVLNEVSNLALVFL